VYYNSQMLLEIASDPDCDINFSGGQFYVENRNSEAQGTHPAEAVSWYGAVAFCNWLSEKEGRSPAYNLSTWSLTNRQGGGYRLPSEAEWEYACRGSSSNPNRYAPFSLGMIFQ
jgi:formylglycine-generating enzyme required for sulfatase activity